MKLKPNSNIPLSFKEAKDIITEIYIAQTKTIHTEKYTFSDRQQLQLSIIRSHLIKGKINLAAESIIKYGFTKAEILSSMQEVKKLYSLDGISFLARDLTIKIPKIKTDPDFYKALRSK